MTRNPAMPKCDLDAPVMAPGDGGSRLSFPATRRNRDPIAAVLARVLPPGALVLEVACGSGEHTEWFASALPGRRWRPTDAEPSHARAAATRLDGTQGVEPVRLLDVRALPWPAAITHEIGAIVAINLIHIAPWSVTEALMAGAGAALPPGGPLYLYGPFKRDGSHTADSNAAFDRSLRGQDPAWGVRDLGDVTAEAARHGLTLSETVAMPANNLSAVFRKRAG
jgi:hypothetical protein